MIHYVDGDATNPLRVAPEPYRRFIVHCCNDVGAWGAGFVKALSERWPLVEERYRDLDGYDLGDVQFVMVDDDVTVCNLIGQHGVGVGKGDVPPIRYDAIYQGLTQIEHFAFQQHATIHMPRMGSGLAGGSWRIMEAIIAKVCKRTEVYVYDLPNQRFNP